MSDDDLDADLFARLVQVCERLHRNQVPLLPEQVAREFGGRVTQTQVRHMLESPRLARALEARGIAFTPHEALSAKQMHALSIYMDTSVPMNHRERLRAARVTQAQWDGWMRNPRFAASVEELAEERLAGSIPLAHTRLLEAVDRGERWAIELLYQITGRFSANQQGADPRTLFAAMFEALDESGVPEHVLAAVGQRFRELASPGSPAGRAATVMLAPSSRPADGFPEE